MSIPKRPVRALSYKSHSAGPKKAWGPAADHQIYYYIILMNSLQIVKKY